MSLGAKGIEWLESRSISVETAVRCGVSTGRHVKHEDGSSEVVPDDRGNILIFPFIDSGRTATEKYRLIGQKTFWQRPGGRRTFWNADILDDPALEHGHVALTITEGEPDALVAIDCGNPFAVSVPDGAPAVPDGEAPDELAPLAAEDEAKGKFEFLWNNRDRLKKIKRFILAVDNDAPGKRLAAELVRRLSPARCSFVTYPEGCKDLNDVRIKFGAAAVNEVLAAAKPYPVRGLYRLSDYPQLADLQTFKTGWWTIDDILKLRLFPGAFIVVTGVPGHGKSSWVLNLVASLSRQYRWKSAIFSPEMPAVPFLRDKLRRIIAKQDLLHLDEARIRRADEWIERSVVFIDGDPTGQAEEDYDLDWLLERATDAVMRDGIRLLIIDPWNEVEHARKRDESMTDYIGRSIRSLKRFAHAHGVAVIVVAHPTKEVGKDSRDGRPRAVTLYDIEGSAHWFNKCDLGIVIDRQDPERDEATIRVAKVRFDGTGERGSVKMAFNRATSCYETLDGSEEAR